MNKKVMILIVIIECILAILLIAVIGKAIESYYNEINAQEICFTTFSKDAEFRLKEGETEDIYERTADGRIILRPGLVYYEKENYVETLPNPEYAYEGVTDDIIIVFANPEDVMLQYVILPNDTSDNAVTFVPEEESKEFVEIEPSGRVHFLGAEVHEVIITVMTKNNKSAVVHLQPRKSNKTNSVSFEVTD